MMTDFALTDEDIDRFIDDPSLIESRELACDIIDTLDHEIANISAQVEVAEVKMRAGGDVDDDWLHRATYAKAMRINQRDRIYRRCR